MAATRVLSCEDIYHHHLCIIRRDRPFGRKQNKEREPIDQYVPLSIYINTVVDQKEKKRKKKNNSNNTTAQTPSLHEKKT